MPEYIVNAEWSDGLLDTLGRHPFSGPVTSAGELLHTPKQISTFMTTVPL